jgi:hypothetical protein
MGKAVSVNAQAAFMQIGFAIVAAVALGVSFPLLHKLLPGTSYIAKGASFGLLAWTATIVLVPITGVRLHGLTLGLEAPLAALILHVVYGLLLGIGFQDLSEADQAKSQKKRSTNALHCVRPLSAETSESLTGVR